MILLVLVFASNFVFTWFIPIARVCVCTCTCVASENQALTGPCCVCACWLCLCASRGAERSTKNGSLMLRFAVAS